MNNCYEAGRDGFWLHRFLESRRGIGSTLTPTRREMAGCVLKWIQLTWLLAALAAVGCARSVPVTGGMPSAATPLEIAEAERLMALSLDSWIEQTARIQRISQKIRIAGRDLCGREVSAVLGAAVIDVDSLTAELRPVALERLGKHGRLHVVEVFPGMPAERAGVVRGDSVVSVAGRLSRRLSRLSRSIGSEVDNVEIEVERDGELLELDLPVELGCGYVAALVRTYWGANQINADLRGSTVSIHLALAHELSDDDTLAVVIGHEIAHGILRRELGRWRSGPELEARADRLGCYLAARAGFDLADEMKLLEVLMRDLDRLGEKGTTHPATHERTLALRKALEEIEDKRRRGEPLVPDSL